MLVLEVPKGTGKTQSSVDPTLLYVASRLLDSFLFLRQIWLMIRRQGNCRSSSAQNGSRVTNIGDIVSILCHQGQHCSSPCPICDLLGVGILDPEAFTDNIEVLLSSRAEEKIVHAMEEICQSARVVLELEVRLIQNFLGQHLGDVVRDFRSTVTIEHCEEMHSFCDLLTDDGILHGLAPTQLKGKIPCISQEVKARPFKHLHSIFFARSGFLRQSELMTAF